MEQAGTKMEAAEKSGDSQAQADAMGQMMGALMGAGGKVEALEPSVLKGFLPNTLGDLPRTSFSAERNAAMGMQIAEAKASYGDGGNRSLDLEIIDRETEARLAVSGCGSLVDHGVDGVVLFDIGGGSSEIALIDVSGLEVEALYGWFDRRPFDDESREFVWVTRKPE